LTALDTNVLVYALDRDEGAKCERAQQVIAAAANAPLRLPLQAVSETFTVLVRKRTWPKRDARAVLEALLPHIPVQPASIDDACRAMSLSEKQDLSYWDALIVVVAASAGCDTLLTEDLQDGRLFTGGEAGRAVRIVNPFDDANLAFLNGSGLIARA
jgi:predicted nucleic acid-binding protein